MAKYVIEYKERYRRWLEGYQRWDTGEWRSKSVTWGRKPDSFSEVKADLESKDPHCEVEVITFYPYD